MIKETEIKGPFGVAWPFDMEVLGKDSALVTCHAVKVPWANNLWDTYVIAMMHLRPMPGKPDADIRLPGATHEVMVFAMQPEYRFNPAKTFVGHTLSPTNFVGQFISASDDVAASRVRSCVVAIVHGDLSPDTDFIQHWIHLFSASNIKGDPARAGETIIQLSGPDGRRRDMTIDPAPLTKKPKDTLCKFCGMPAVAVQVVGFDACIRCAARRNLFNPNAGLMGMLFGK